MLGIIMLPVDIERYVKRIFAPEQQLEAMELLAHAKRHDGLAAEPRLFRCALIASDGTLQHLKSS